MEALIAFLLSGVCHQLPTHCLHFEGRPLPLCARCTGAFMGVVLGVLLLAILGEGRRSQLPSRRSGGALVTLVGLWVLDGLNSLARQVMGHSIYPPLNSLRLLTGMGCGLAIGAVLYPIFQLALWGGADSRRALQPAWHLAALLAAGGTFAGVMLGWPSAPWALWAVAGAAATVGVLSAANAALVVLALKKERVAHRPRDLATFGAIGLLAALAEMSGLALLRLVLIGSMP